jgi:hypothetical protein
LAQFSLSAGTHRRILSEFSSGSGKYFRTHLAIYPYGVNECNTVGVLVYKTERLPILRDALEDPSSKQLYTSPHQ